MSIQTAQARQIREGLLARRAELESRSRRVENDLARRNEPLAQDFADQAIQLENDQALTAIRDAASQEMHAIDEALERLEVGLYGICERCSGPIAPARLAAVPQAVVCTACVSS
jgi:DnaK suppressor protein